MRAKEFIDEEVVPFPSPLEMSYKKFRDSLSDEEKYAMAMADQQAELHGEPDHMNPDHDKEVAYDMQNMGDPDYDKPGADTGLSPKDVDAMDLSPKGMAVSREELDRIMKNAGIKSLPNIHDVDEGSKENANALVGSGRADPHGKKTNPDSPEHKKVRTPGTTYTSSRHKKQDWPATKHGANPGFVGG